MASYTADEANVMWAVPDFLHTLRMMMVEMGMEKVHLLAHSMGSRLVIYSLLRMHPELLPPGSATIGRVSLLCCGPEMEGLIVSKVALS